MICILIASCLATALPPDPATSFAQARVVPANAPLVHTSQVFPDAAGDTAAQTRQAMHRLGAAVGGLDQLVRLHGIVSPEADERAVLGELQRSFPDVANRPALSLVRSPIEKPGVLAAFDAVAISQGGSAVYGQSAILPPDGRIDIAGQVEKGDGTLAGSTRATLESLERTLKFLGSDRSKIVQIKGFMKPMGDAATVRRVVKEYFQGQEPPLVLVEWNMPSPIEIELVAATGPGTPAGLRYITPPGMTSSPVFSRTAIAQGRFETIYTAGLTAPPGTPFKDQASPIFGQLKTILADTGSDLNHLTKATYYVANPDANKSLDMIRPSLYDPMRPPAASKAGVAGVIPSGGRGLLLDMIAVRLLP